ncbi:hypothetical protein AYK61_17215 [Rhodococcus sp. SBT000017]|uniref:hypothetical protein n=2 Tax=unclassified Rhodococcus (in: high G+C Gram-positive bacteria) TaxID=192944 RepID=UPI000EF95A45|nr:hypothetical protein [Rhodococcus sp. SBT000017]RMB77934.1 hypothetical protein AYK61_17215 [Rhodococcus sp. SBT000017]
MKVLSMLLAGLTVGYAIGDIRPFDSLLSSTAEFGSLATIVNGLTVLALTACLTSVALARSSARGVLVVAIGAVLVVLFRTVGMVTGMFGDWAGAVGAGALLGASAVLAGRHRGAQASLAVAAIGAGLLGTALDALLQVDDGPVFVWDVVGAEDAVVPERAIIMVIAALGGALSLFLAHRDVALQSHETRRTLLVGLPLPVAAGVLSWFAGGHDSGDAVWFGALAGMAVLAVVAAFAFPGRDGRVLLVLFASATIGSMGFAVEDSLQLAVSAALLVVGAGIGYRWPQLYVGLGGLLLVAGAALIEGYVALPPVSQFALPFVVAYAVASTLSTAPGSLAVALPALFTMTLPVTVYAASYQPGLSSSTDAVATRTSEPDHLMLSVAGLVVVAVVTVACVLLMRRPTQNPAAR